MWAAKNLAKWTIKGNLPKLIHLLSRGAQNSVLVILLPGNKIKEEVFQVDRQITPHHRVGHCPTCSREEVADFKYFNN
jgi:hypothetical protein